MGCKQRAEIDWPRWRDRMSGRIAGRGLDKHMEIVKYVKSAGYVW